MYRVMVIDYGLGNTDSVRRAFEECGAQVHLGRTENDFADATHIVLPGVGSFPEGMDKLHKFGIPELLNKYTRIRRTPLLGICLGMQLLADRGFEHKETEGLGYVSGRVIQLVQKVQTDKVPHVGWNDVVVSSPCSLLDGIPSGKDFYFVHSYHLQCDDRSQVIATTPYCGGFVSIVNNENIWGTQFHPEKSQRVGIQLLKNFLKS